MSNQRTLDLFRRPEVGDAVPQDPALWIEEVRLLKSFSPNPEEQIREPITFQKGLNIIWASAPPMKQRKEINFAGHAAGKTTLCRLLRYLLGEHNTAAPGVKEAIEENFHNGWIVGKIHVLDKTWIVARPLHHFTRPRARCIIADSIEELLNNPEPYLPFDDFLNQLEAATTARLPVKLLGDGSTRITFAHVIQWLARDQDCHFTKLHFFRHSDSKSESPNLTAEAAYFLQRVMLHLADPDLQKAITNCEKLEKEEKELPADKEYQLKREIELNEFLENANLKDRQAPLLSEILIGPTRRLTHDQEEQRTKNTSDAIKLAKEALQGFQKELPVLQERLGGVKVNIAAAKAAIKSADETIAALDGEKLDLEVEKEKAKKLPPSAYCRVPRALAANCRTFCEWDVLSENEEEKGKLIARQKKDAANHLNLCRTNLRNFEEEQKSIEASIKSITAESKSVEAKIESLGNKLKSLVAPFVEARTKIDELEAAIRKLARLEKREDELKGEVEKAKKLQEEIQQRHKLTENQFEDEYAWAVAQIFGGKETDTKCKFTREKITTNVAYRGKDLTSAAVTALQVFCFDLAAMTFSCRGRGFHPRFLLHDSPREADMGEAPYGRIFDLIIEQSKERANFQHIITTTTQPPEEYQTLPYLRLKLDSADSKGRLFTRDL